MKCLVPLTLANYKDLAKPGKVLATPDGFLEIKANNLFNENLCVGERGTEGGSYSIKAFLEKYWYDEVYIISDI